VLTASSVTRPAAAATRPASDQAVLTFSLRLARRY
jgi:hypothetical protein